MAKDPAFLFYPDNFQSGTQFFTDEQTGKYIRLICAQHLHGHLTTKQMLLICKKKDPAIWEKFSIDEQGKFYQKRLEIEVLKRKKISEHQRENAKKRWDKKAMPPHMPNGCQNDAMAMPLGNGNGNVFVLNSNTGIHEDSTVLSVFTLEAAERNQFTHTGKANTEFIKHQWETFLLERKNDPSHKQRQNVGRIQEYFLNWIRTKFPKENKNGKKMAGLDADEFIKQKLKK